jgi:O-antigen ligase
VTALSKASYLIAKESFFWIRLLIPGVVLGLVAGSSIEAIQVGALLGCGVSLIGIVALFRPELGIVILLFLAADALFINQAIDIRILGGGFELRDLFLIFMWLVVAARYGLGKVLALARTPLGLLVSIFLIGAGLSGVWSFLSGTAPLLRVMQEFRAIASYTVFFLIPIVAQTRRRFNTIIHGLIVIALGLAMITTIQYVVGAEFVFTGGRVQPKMMGTTRVLLPSAFMVNAAAVLIVGRLAFTKRRRIRIGLLIVLGILALAVLLTFSRNLWFADVAVICLLFPFINLRSKMRLAILALVTILILGVMIVSFSATSDDYSLSTILSRRMLQPFQMSLFEEQRTLGGRIREAQLAFEKIASHPLTGIGVGNRYYEYGDEIWLRRKWDEKDEEHYNYLPYFIHCGYLWIAMKMGLIVFSIWGLFLFRLLWIGYWAFRQATDYELKGIIAGLVLGVVGLCISGIVVPVFMRASDVITLTTLMGLIVAGHRLSMAGSGCLQSEEAS